MSEPEDVESMAWNDEEVPDDLLSSDDSPISEDVTVFGSRCSICCAGGVSGNIEKNLHLSLKPWSTQVLQQVSSMSLPYPLNDQVLSKNFSRVCIIGTSS